MYTNILIIPIIMVFINIIIIVGPSNHKDACEILKEKRKPIILSSIVVYLLSIICLIV